MRAALDAGPLVLSSGGLHRYVTELALALGRAFPEDEFPLLSDQPFKLPHGAGPNVFAAPGPANWFEKRWWTYGASKTCARLQANVFHGTNFAVPYRGKLPSVLTLHDLSPWMNPEWHSGADRVRTRAPRMIEQEATLIVTPTEAIRRQAITHFALAPERVFAIPHGASPNFRPAATTPDPHPYFLFVGTWEPRKNITGLLEAWRALNTNVRLLIAGRRRADFPQPNPESGIEWLGEIPETDLPALYSGALAVVYPSFYEGFGLPVLEAMQCGACVITSRDPAITEVAAGAALQAANVTELSQAMRAVIDQPELAAAFREKALARSAEFSWERSARSTYAVYQEAISRFAAN